MEKIIKKYGKKYTVTDAGFVFSLKGSKKELKGKINNAGYREVVISHKSQKKYVLVHRLIAENFIPNPKKYRTVNHKDGNKLNNNVNNLEWCSDRMNLIHARDNGMLKTKISMEIAEEIRRDKGTHRELAEKYKLSKTQIGYIKKGLRWTK